MKTLILCLALLLIPVIARAEDDTRKPEVIKAEAYLKDLTTAKARFLQTAPDGTQLIGTFYLSRPGRLRFVYDNSRDFVVADGFFIYFYDSQLKQQSNAPIGQTLADFLLRKNLRLKDDLKVTSVEHRNGLQLLTIVQTKDAAAGSLTLAFQDEPYQLKKWRVVDGSGAITEVELFQLEADIPLESKLFAYSDPLQGKVQHFNQ